MLWTQPEDNQIFATFRNDVPASSSLFGASARRRPKTTAHPRPAADGPTLRPPRLPARHAAAPPRPVVSPLSSPGAHASPSIRAGDPGAYRQPPGSARADRASAPRGTRPRGVPPDTVGQVRQGATGVAGGRRHGAVRRAGRAAARRAARLALARAAATASRGPRPWPGTW